jgi:hypothetical protein
MSASDILINASDILINASDIRRLIYLRSNLTAGAPTYRFYSLLSLSIV